MGDFVVQGSKVYYPKLIVGGPPPTGTVAFNATFDNVSSGSASYTELSPIGATGTGVGGALTDNFDGREVIRTNSASTGGFKFPVNAAYDLASDDFTIEVVIRHRLVIPTASRWYMATRAQSVVIDPNFLGWAFGFNGTTNQLRFIWRDGVVATTQEMVRTIPSFAPNVWYKFKITRESGVARMFVDDVQIGSTQSIGAISAGLGQLCLGGLDSGSGVVSSFDGWHDSARIVTGLAENS